MTFSMINVNGKMKKKDVYGGLDSHDKMVSTLKSLVKLVLNEK